MKTFQKAPIALAVAALLATPAAFAQQGGGGSFDSSSSVSSDFTNNIDVDLRHYSNTRKNFRVNVRVNDRADYYSGAAVDSKQFIERNAVVNEHSENNARVGEAVGSGASGNIGINVAAGDNNAQANDTALAASDARDVFGQSEIYSAQSVQNNLTLNSGVTNNARVAGNTLQGATGNIGLNVAAGNNNAQQNSLAASSNGNAGHTRATVGGVQQSSGNVTGNARYEEETVEFMTMDQTITLDTVNLTMDQEGNIYPDTWGADSNDGNHTSSPRTGHFDLNDDVQYDNPATGGTTVPDYNDDGGALAFKSTEDSVLSGTITGQVPVTITSYYYHSNDASLGGNSLSGASGNIGVNIAAGTGNMQRNSLSIASSLGGSTGGGANGGG